MNRFKLLSFFIIVFLISNSVQSQNDILSKAFHKEKRDSLRAVMPENSIALFFAQSNNTNDAEVENAYYQDANFYYLTGYREDNAVLVMYADEQLDDEGEPYNEIIFMDGLQKLKDECEARSYKTARAGLYLGFDIVYARKDFFDFDMDYRSYDKVFINGQLSMDSNSNGISKLINSFKSKTAYNNSDYLSPLKEYFYSVIKESTATNRTEIVGIIKEARKNYAEIEEDEFVTRFVDAETEDQIQVLQEEVTSELTAKNNVNIYFLQRQMKVLRESKSEVETNIIKKSAKIASVGLNETMKVLAENSQQSELEEAINFVYEKYNTDTKGCFLNLTTDEKIDLSDHLVQVTLKSVYRGFHSIVTRTLPKSGAFSKEEQSLYDLVYQAQEAGVEQFMVDHKISATKAAAELVIKRGLLELGIIKTIDEQHPYVIETNTTHVGLESQDLGNYTIFENNMVSTFAVGLSIPEGSPCDKKWWGINILLQDNILVTQYKPLILTDYAPRKASEIKKTMQSEFGLNPDLLPELTN